MADQHDDGAPPRVGRAATLRRQPGRVRGSAGGNATATGKNADATASTRPHHPAGRRTAAVLPRWARQFGRIDPTAAGGSGGGVEAAATGYDDGGDADAHQHHSAAAAAASSAAAAEEDRYLRREAYGLASSAVDKALGRAWECALRGDGTAGGRRRKRRDEGGLAEEGGALVRDLDAFFAAYRPEPCPPSSSQLLLDAEEEKEGEGDSKRRRLDGNGAHDDDVLVNFLLPPARDPTLTPLALLSVGPSVLDRIEVAKLVHRGLAAHCSSSGGDGNDDNNRAAVCVLRGGPYRNSSSSSSGTGRSFHGQLLRDVLAQCVAQEPHRSQYLYLLDGARIGASVGTTTTAASRRFKHVSYAERITEWAGLTESFHSVVVVVEDPESLPHRTYEAFLAAVAELRTVHGVPIGLVLASIDHVGGGGSGGGGGGGSGGGTLSRSALGGIAGIDVRSFAVPPSDVVLDHLIRQLFISEEDLAVILGAPLLRDIRASFLDNHRSVVEAAMQIKAALAHQLVQRGSFLSMAQILAFANAEWPRIAWFCVDKGARSFIMASSSSRDADMSSRFCASRIRTMIWRQRMFVLVNAWIRHARDLLPSLGRTKAADLMIDFGLVEGRVSQSSSFDELFQALGEFIRKLPIGDVQALLLRWRDEMKQRETSFAAADDAFRLVYEYVDESGDDIIWKLTEEELNSFIVLFDRQESEGRALEDESAVCKELRASLVHSLEVKSRMLKDLNMPFSSDRVKEDSEAVISSGVGSLLPQVRRGTARALAHPPALPNRETSITHDPLVVFQAMTTRVVEIEEWYKAFTEEIGTSSPTIRGGILWQRFIFAVHQLEMCGLVCRSRRRGGNAYEKTAMVWASGS